VARECRSNLGNAHTWELRSTCQLAGDRLTQITAILAVGFTQLFV
jgi:hypothetical protein